MATLRRLARLGPLLAACLLLGACDDVPAPAGGTASSGSGSFPCEPTCGDGYACDDGVCVPTCEPTCPAGTTCDETGACVAEAGDAFDDLLRNPCGGTAALDGQPGEPCGPCGDGRWLCASDDVAVCVDPVGRNACGGCGALPGAPGDACDGDGVWACAPDTGLTCAAEVNACGGTEALEAAPGRPCGTCNAGAWVCEGPNAVRCREAVPAPDPASCACDPSTERWVPCGTDAGACARGARPCLPDGTVGPCVRTGIGAACGSDDDCDPGAVCLTEAVHPFESLEDDCIDGTEPSCTRRRCHAPQGATPCTRDTDCLPTQACAHGVCEALAPPPTDERCNGIDDDCDGRIDNDERRTEICGVCPYNTLLITNADRDFGRRRICMDVVEASRPDATDTDAGTLDTYAQPDFSALPWTDVTPEEAVAACAGDGYNAQIPGGVVQRRLCIADEWQLGCEASGAAYPYGDDHIAGACNDASLETDGPLPTGRLDECAYVQPRGRFPHLDMVGNVAEWVRGTDRVVAAGGAWNTSPDDATCAARADAEASPSIGFRCCATPLVGNF